MPDDLVTWLREAASRHNNYRCDEAADRIERLETVLRDLLHFEMAHVGPYAGQKVIAARAALEGKDAPA